MLTNVGGFLPIRGIHRPTSTKFGRILPNVGQTRPTSDNLWHKSTNCGGSNIWADLRPPEQRSENCWALLFRKHGATGRRTFRQLSGDLFLPAILGVCADDVISTRKRVPLVRSRGPQPVPEEMVRCAMRHKHQPTATSRAAATATCQPEAGWPGAACVSAQAGKDDGRPMPRAPPSSRHVLSPTPNPAARHARQGLSVHGSGERRPSAQA